MQRIFRATIALTFVTLAFAGCDRDEAQPERADSIEPPPIRERVEGEVRDDGAGEPAADVAVRGWPSGWMVTEEDALVPVVDEVGRDLATARSAFQDGERDRSAEALNRAADRLANTEIRAEGAAAVEQAVRDLRDLGQELASGTDTTLARFDRVANQAYRADLDHAWVNVHDEGVAVFMARPDEHLVAARRAIKDGSPDAVVDQLKRAIALYRLEEVRIAPSERASAIEDRLHELDLYTDRVGREEGSLDGLDRRISEIEGAFAQHYVGRARQDLDADRNLDAGRALLALAVHLHRQDTACGSEPDANAGLSASVEQAGTAMIEERETPDVRATLDRVDAVLTERDPQRADTN
ncbi:MAG: hypothetical protein AB7S26_20540 [Sandaracinaceae bacterium]